MDHFVTKLTYEVIALRIVAAIIIGGIIGYGREKNNRPAGFRTHILVCLGAAIISLIQDGLRLNIMEEARRDPLVATVIKTDLGRLGAQVVSGIGFLGAGSIMRERGTVGGLTTAAGIWATGCIGLAIGWGFYQITFIATAAVIVTLITLKKLEVSWIAKRTIARVLVEHKEGLSGESIAKISEYFKEEGIKILGVSKDEEERTALFTIRVKRNLKVSEILMAIAGNKEVEKVRRED